MSIQSEINRISGNVADAFSAVAEKGGTVPEEQVSGALGAAVRSIPAGDASVLVNAPVGAILIWSGPATSIPAGWALCDGQDGRPDLRDKFVLGAGENHPVGETGGSETVTLTEAQMPKHSHNTRGFQPAYVPASGTSNPVQTTIVNQNYDSKTYTAGGTSPHNNMPPYYALCYIICVAEGGGSGGADGTTFVPSVSTDGTLSWTNDGGLENPEPVNIRGPAGADGSKQVWSTEETVIGTWVDGRPRYRKCYNLSFQPDETITVNANSGYSAKVLEADFSLVDPTGVVISGEYGGFQLFSFNGMLFYQVKFNMDGLVLIVTNPSFQSNLSVLKSNSIYVCMEYCKVTDTPAT